MPRKQPAGPATPVGTFHGPSRTITVEPIRVPKERRVIPVTPREPAQKPERPKPKREPVPTR
jgi:hypothetical protein